MTVVGDMTQYGSHINVHFESVDIITALFYVVDHTAKGGSINFYDGLDEKIKDKYIQVFLVNTEGLQ